MPPGEPAGSDGSVLDAIRLIIEQGTLLGCEMRDGAQAVRERLDPFVFKYACGDLLLGMIDRTVPRCYISLAQRSRSFVHNVTAPLAHPSVGIPLKYPPHQGGSQYLAPSGRGRVKGSGTINQHLWRRVLTPLL
jgi:hypothetical protein